MKKLSLLSSIMMMIMLVFGLNLQAQEIIAKMTKMDPTEKIPFNPEVKMGTLSNGLTYYIKNNGKPENKVELRLVVNAGSILEDDDQLGLAHFMEHMNFNGTKNFKKMI